MRGFRAIACVFLCSAALGETREWTVSGESVRAEYVKFSFGVVTLKTDDGKQLRMPLARLAPEDRVYVAEMRKKGGRRGARRRPRRSRRRGG
jgi:hypothetical protein